MSKILAVAGLTFRTAVRSRVLALLVALIVASVLWLPFIIKSDGTAEGMVHLYLHYALGWTVILISMTTLWAGAGSFSQEVESRQIHLVATKPARVFHLWAGKWLGLLWINAVLLGLAGLLVYSMLGWTVRSSGLSESERAKLSEEILIARRSVPVEPDTPRILDVDSYGPAHAGRVGTGPGGSLSWRFQVPARLRPDDTILVQYHFASSRITDTAPIKMLWMAGPEDDPKRHAVSVSSAPNISHIFSIPAGLADSAGEARLTYLNVEQERPSYVLFSENDGVQLRVREGGFEMNYLRALLVLFARLSFFSALGLAAGALFSFPVSIFLVLAFLFMTGFTRFIETVVATGLQAMPELWGAETVLLLEPVLQKMFAMMNMLMPPLWRYDPFDALATGGLVSWHLVGSAFLVFTCAYSGVLAVSSGWLFSRREFA